ncbi:hypothetical protein, conserved [Trypanosoma brucei gambiense DAL972]|uniref:Uncharacterized protein n=3 Tax=Trypanosoma brucei TaxID=5691 RepID=Q581A2_TRYB2|nr:hypothetical protein, conserved [Trypanosoma brucei gambiense DAL972]XP_847213.1 hypothetical protein, conserved [Trypanosoma brucei brucei TREU927]AAX78951.1 hypothetical protein, conserved [Trypanosoma brucei]RHW71069.1 hypothetical protein DPX39_080041100 [Trypanosoma brucei equiperdum]AAZ13147.1 hypothetical protein, conserved [Trypanosoma brucei brucei TREU927]CBH13406.1 hypothetical protein, conserved [Trypanosoma brucei gambiense DAL972]|eukprot:XP_011775683.1 hypothetical protein, conserved [Trypanosoma brucei gambiense DAL972]
MNRSSDAEWNPASFNSPDLSPETEISAARLVEDDVSPSTLPGFGTSPFVGSGQPPETADEKAVYMRIINDMEQECGSDDDEEACSANNLLPPSAISGANADNSDGKGAGASGIVGGFTVEESHGLSSRGYVPPPVYGSSPQPANSPYSYTTTPHNGHPPPSFAVAIATTPPLSGMPVDMSPLGSRFAPQMPAAQHDPILVRNQYGVFMLQPVTKPTPPYTPPVAVTTPMTPMTGCALPPATLPPLCTAVQQAGEDLGAATKVPGAYNTPLASGAGVGGSHILSCGVAGVAGTEGVRGGGTYTFMSACMKSPAAPVHVQPPPPYPYEDAVESNYQRNRGK